MKTYISIFVIWFFIGISNLISQQLVTLDDIYQLVISHSSVVQSASNQRNIAEHNFKFFKSQLRPQLSLNADLPNYLQTSVPVTQPDGSISFQSVSQANSSGGLTLTQLVPLTGATVFAASQLNRFDNFSNEMVQYNGIPMRFGIIQPIFGFNAWKYNRKIESLNLEEAQRQFDIDLESSRSTATQLYFDILIADQDLTIAENNKLTNLQLSDIAQERYKLGKVSKDETLQLEIQLKQSDLALAQAMIAKTQAINALYTFIGIEAPDSITAQVPKMINRSVDIESIKATALNHRPEVIAYQRSLVEAQSTIAETKANFGLRANLTASFGLARGADAIQPIYNDPFIEQQVNVGINIPLVDWGRRKAAVNAATIQKEDLHVTFDQVLRDIDNEIVARASRHQSLQQEAQLQADIVKVAEERANIAQERYVLGDIDITNLTIAQQQKDQALRDYIRLLQTVWVNYQELRTLTGYDIISQSNIIY